MVNQDIFWRSILAALAGMLLLAPAAQAADPLPGGLEIDLDFEQFPLESTCEGADISPQMEIKGCNSSSLAIILEDPDAPSGTFVHWIIWNIPPSSVIPPAMARNAAIDHPFPARQGYNDFGEIGYAGPCPPSGKPHRYLFRVFGLDRMLDLPAGASTADLREAMRGHILQQGQAMARFGR
ncbi:MAG: YbhB/YbcL family Raf kinase inhibitor-like protein [Methanothrix sp.]|nr:YbhB/YbcL family Raf kinase inhibitor-like protein [Methanothrix sp.]OYV10717.1 MAG: hypothetical protein CG446_1020 [Methanosaeta sp. ASO1]